MRVRKSGVYGEGEWGVVGEFRGELPGVGGGVEWWSEWVGADRTVRGGQPDWQLWWWAECGYGRAACMVRVSGAWSGSSGASFPALVAGLSGGLNGLVQTGQFVAANLIGNFGGGLNAGTEERRVW